MTYVGAGSQKRRFDRRPATSGLLLQPDIVRVRWHLSRGWSRNSALISAAIFATPAALNAGIFVLSLACASAMIFLIPRGNVVVSEELIEQVEEESGMP